MNPVIKKVKEIIKKEIKYLLHFYPYNIKKFLDTRLLHTSSILAFKDKPLKFNETFLNKLINLMVGLELLAIGLNLHDFDVEDLSMLASNIDLKINKINKSVIEKRYTIDLLYGDIFYSRAVIYILQYGNFLTFNSILEALKRVHKSRLFTHQKLLEYLNTNKAYFKKLPKKQELLKSHTDKIVSLIEENANLISDMNFFLKNSFYIGWNIFLKDKKQKFPDEIVDGFISLKTFYDLEGFFYNLPKDFYFLKEMSYIKDNEKLIKDKLCVSIENLEIDFLKNNFKSLVKLYS